MYHAFADNDNRWVDQEADPTEVIFAESFSDLPWELRDPIDLPTNDTVIHELWFPSEA